MRTTALFTGFAALVLLPLAAAAEETFDYTYFDMNYVNNGMDNAEVMVDGPDTIAVNMVDGTGIGVRGSLALTPNVHVFGGYAVSDLGLDAVHTVAMPTVGQMRDAFYATPGSENWDAPCDLNGDGAINSVDLGMMRAAGDTPRMVETAAVDGDLTDWRVGVGVNGLLTSRISGYAQIFWDDRDLGFDTTYFAGEPRDASADDNGFGAAVGARGKVTERVELTGSVTYTPVGDIDLLADAQADRLRDDTLFGIGGRFWLTDNVSLLAAAEGDGDVRAWTLGMRYDMNVSN